MKLLGFEISRALTTKDILSQVSSNRGWHRIYESFAGAWQKNVEVDQIEITSHSAVFACMSLIARDVSKLGAPEFKRKEGEVWEVDESPAYSPVLREPNQFQTPNQFWEYWIFSKLIKGNTYALKGRDERRVVNRLWVLDPCGVTPLISESGDVFYQCRQDNLSGIKSDSLVIPASEIIHDRMNTLWHPLVGISPLYAAGMAAQMGLNITKEGAIFFNNRRIPGGILTAPATIDDVTAARLKRDWEQGGEEQIGRTRVLGDGLDFKAMAMTATDSQMLELAKATAEWVCSAFHVPPYKIGIGSPVNTNVQSLNLEYYAQAIQSQLEDIEAVMLRGLEMKAGTKVEFDQKGIYRMDTVSQIQSLRDAVGASILSINEARAQLDYGPTAGGDSPLSQQQYYSLEAIAKRDEKPDPFKTETAKLPPPAKDTSDDTSGDEQRLYIPNARDILRKARDYERHRIT